MDDTDVDAKNDENLSHVQQNFGIFICESVFFKNITHVCLFVCLSGDRSVRYLSC